MQDFVSIPTSDASCLKRFIGAGLLHEVNYKIPTNVQQYMRVIGGDEAKKLFELWNKTFKRSGVKKISVDTDKKLFQSNPVWNLRHVHRIQDEFLRKLIYHQAGYKFDNDIHYAIEKHRAEDQKEIFRFIGYGIYAKISDEQLAKRWNMSIGQVSAIRLLFFDFSRFPKDRIANFTYLRQLANAGSFDEVDFVFFKKVFELGELGIKAHIDFPNLTNEEKNRVTEFLGHSAITATLNINLAIKTQKDAQNYGLVLSNLADYFIKQKEASYFDAKIRNLDATTRRIEGTMVGDVGDMSELDRNMLDHLRQVSLTEAPQIKYKTLADLKK